MPVAIFGASEDGVARNVVKAAGPVAVPMPLFSEAGSVEAVNARIGPVALPRAAAVLSALVRHLHAFIKDVEPTEEEWLAAIGFLTETGKLCTEWRQEFILLSDVLGVTMLVDAINHRRPAGATENTILGPFYVVGAPARADGETICLDMKGEPLLVHGRVLDTAGKPVPGATIDIWQTNDDGFYDVQQPQTQPVANLRGLFTALDDGSYCFRSAKPRYYPIPGDGTVGKLLAALDRSVNRAAHIHAIVRAPGFGDVVTHLFEPNCPYLRNDAVFGVKESLIADFRKIETPGRLAAAGFKDAPFYWDVAWDFVLAPAAGTHGQ